MRPSEAVLLFALGGAAGWSAPARPSRAPPLAPLHRPAARAAVWARSKAAKPADDDDSWESATWEVAVRFADDEEEVFASLAADGAARVPADAAAASAGWSAPAAAGTSAAPTVDGRGEASPAAPPSAPVASGGDAPVGLGLEWVEPVGTPEDEEDDSAVSVTEFYPLLLERKYGANWATVLEEAEREAGGKGPGEGDFAPASVEDYVGYGEDELREMVRKVQQAEENGEREPSPVGLDGADEAALKAAAEMAAERAEAQARFGFGDSTEGEPAGWADRPTASSPAKSRAAAGKSESGEGGDNGDGGSGESLFDVSEAIGLSASLEAYMAELAAGEVDVPDTYPATEWLHVWSCATSPKRCRMISATYANLRVLLHKNFDDFDSLGPSAEPSNRERALLKARAILAATGQPGIAESTVVYVDAAANKPASERAYIDSDTSPIDALLGRAKPISEPDREVVYITDTAFVSHNLTLEGYGELRMPMLFATADHLTIAQSSAHNDLFVKVCETLGLEFVGNSAFDEFYEMQNSEKGKRRNKKTAGTTLLTERLLRDATVLDADILKVSSFVNHMVDVEMMEACGEELAERFESQQATKVLTVEATGLLPAVFVAKALGLPCIFARKQRQISISDSYQTSFKSSVSSSVQDIYVSTEYLSPGDRVLIIDDFLAGGRTADAMIRICRMANANVVGGGFLIEKVNDAGRAFLSGYQIPLESIALVSIDDGTISIVEQGERTALSGADISSVDVRGLSNFDLVDGDDGDDDDWYSRGVSAQRV